MRAIPLIAGAALVLSACGGEPSEGSLLALTYNVAGLPEGISKSHPEANTTRIGLRINTYDLALVQEDFSYHHLLDPVARHPYRSTPLMEFETFVNDGLNRFSNFPLGELYRERWPSCFGTLDNSSDCLSSKGWSYAQVWLTDTVAVDVYNHHAEAGGGPEDDAARLEGYQRLAAAIEERSAGRAVIVGGDTNLELDDPDEAPTLQAFLQDAGLTDACTSLACPEDHIDRFMFRSGGGLTLEATDWAVAEEFVDDAGQPLSDHEAVRVRFRWQRD
ncbi:MAG: hypothetical protein KC933_11605 [Myxococcales bacterium]|nr:hypothetical protein [Myxococcales bacterium]